MVQKILDVSTGLWNVGFLYTYFSSIYHPSILISIYHAPILPKFGAFYDILFKMHQNNVTLGAFVCG